MIYDILFAVCGIGLIALGMSLFKLDTRVEAWRVETLRHTRLLNDIDDKQYRDASRLGEAFSLLRRKLKLWKTPSSIWKINYKYNINAI